jgi:transcriptional regulator with PAS, ATPase and Fis domain
MTCFLQTNPMTTLLKIPTLSEVVTCRETLARLPDISAQRITNIIIKQELLEDFEQADLVRIAAWIPPKRIFVDWTKDFVTVHHKDMLSEICKLAYTQDAVFLQGPTGVGKEILAKALHGYRSPETFVPVNCAAIQPTLAESEFFGHKRGAFTGAYEDKDGLIKQANNGTLFLDEVAELPQLIQAKLLRALETKHYRPVGSTTEESFNCRVVVATCGNLSNLREDFYARIGCFHYVIKPLKERPEDIPLIAAKLCPGFPASALPSSTALPFNVRSLQHAIRRWQVFHNEQY